MRRRLSIHGNGKLCEDPFCDVHSRVGIFFYWPKLVVVVSVTKWPLLPVSLCWDLLVHLQISTLAYKLIGAILRAVGSQYGSKISLNKDKAYLCFPAHLFTHSTLSFLYVWPSTFLSQTSTTIYMVKINKQQNGHRDSRSTGKLSHSQQK